MAFYKNAKNLSKIGLSKTTGAAKKAAVGTKNAAGKFVSEKVQPTKLFVDVKTPKDGRPKERLENLYTGKKANPWVVGAAGATLLGTSFTKDAWNHHVFGKLQKATNYDVQDYGAPDIMMYDGVGQERAPKNLNADGSIVFGLHNMRKG